MSEKDGTTSGAQQECSQGKQFCCVLSVEYFKAKAKQSKRGF